MLKKVFVSVALAFQNIRANLFHTLLSVLGIVIGVAALVVILSLIDGLEKYAQDQISKTTSLNMVLVQPVQYKEINQLAIKKDSLQILDYEQYNHLTAALKDYGKTALSASITTEIKVSGKAEPLGVVIRGISSNAVSDTALLAGSMLTTESIARREPLVVINETLARQLIAPDSLANALGQSVQFRTHALRIIGILKNNADEAPPTAAIPITVLSRQELLQAPPSAMFEANSVEQVAGLKTQIQTWLKANYTRGESDFKVLTQEYRAGQATEGFQIFRLIMGLIVGVSVLVGGIGVMNVLLISVTERTPEIGLRKAVGAKKSDILQQFLFESITISAFGSFIGLILGILSTMAFVAIVKMFRKLPFEAAYTGNTFLVIAVVAVVVGVVFGTYPAMKAARLDPVEAIRRE